MNNNNKSQILRSIGLMGLAKLSGFLKISFIFGTTFSWFSASSIAVPLIGAFGGSFSAVIFFALSLIGRFLLGYGFSATIVAFYLPGLCASLYLARGSAAFAILLPLLCIAAFIAHPAGTGAALYTVYWFIPIALCCLKKQTPFTLALTATFIAHAVGSTVWIYTQPTTPLFWLGLIPLVAVERLIYAVGITCMHTLLNVLFSMEKYDQATLGCRI